MFRISLTVSLEEKKENIHHEYKESLSRQRSKLTPLAIEDAIKEFDKSIEVEKISREDTTLQKIAAEQKERLEKKDRIRFWLL